MRLDFHKKFSMRLDFRSLRGRSSTTAPRPLQPVEEEVPAASRDHHNIHPQKRGMLMLSILLSVHLVWVIWSSDIWSFWL